jgi:hypothetical protein
MSATFQDQRLTELNFDVGVVKEKTRLDAGGFWTEADKIRFRFGRPELMGGWQRAVDVSQAPKISGVPRAITSVRSRLGETAAVIGTSQGLFSSELSTFYNITPIVSTLAASNILSTTAGSPKVIVSVSAHNLETTSLVEIVGANTTIGGNIQLCPDVSTAVTYSVSVLTANSFEIDPGVTAVATSVATGGSITINFDYAAGKASTSLQAGWGAGPWGGSTGWGTPPAGGVPVPLRLWSLDLWGTNVMAVPSGGPLMYWDTGLNIRSRATIVTAAPALNQIVRVASEARHVLLYGTLDITGDYSPLLIRWCSQEDFTDWIPSATNTAGDYPLPSRGSEIRAVNRVKDSTAILTDNDLFIQSYIGGNDVFGFTAAGERCGVISRNAAVEYGGTLYWMSANGQFYRYDGRLQPLPCTVLRFIYDNLDSQQVAKIYAGTNSTFDEIIWFYPSINSPDGENDRYVIYNTRENHWTTGSLNRTVWEDIGTFDYPIALDSNAANVFYQEIGYTADGETLAANLEGAYFAQEAGDNIMFVNKFVPDFSNLADSLPYVGTLQISLQARKYPGGPITTKGPFAITSDTQKVSMRLRGRELAFQIQSSTSSDIPWRMGQFRMAIEADGLR